MPQDGLNLTAIIMGQREELKKPAAVHLSSTLRSNRRTVVRVQ